MRGDIGPGHSRDSTEEKEENSRVSSVQLINSLLSRAVEAAASDIHFEPREKCLVVRLRVDGILHPETTLVGEIRDSVVSRIKILANLDISERRQPQDGRLRIRIPSAEKSRIVDVRVSTLPTIFGERVVLRILDPGQSPRSLEDLGLELDSLQKFQGALQRSHGLILVSGPTGSGKTSTLYSSLRYLNRDGVNIVTAEDPVEYSLSGVNQLEIQERIDLNYSRALRSFLRQDPDIIMVGEIRDPETAEISVRAAMTGHLVLTTLHTNDAPSAILRLHELGVEPFLIGNTVRLVCAQRLIRKICETCRQSAEFSGETLAQLPGLARAGSRPAFRGGGCRRCRGTGYRGRTGLFEVLELTATIRDMIGSGKNLGPLVNGVLFRSRLTTLRETGLRKVKAGLTTLEEVQRATLDV